MKILTVSIVVVGLILLMPPAYAQNAFEKFLNEKGSNEESTADQPETNRQLIILQKAMIDNLKEETREHRYQLQEMQAEINLLKIEITQLKQNGNLPSISEQQQQIDQLRAQQDQLARDAIFNEMDAKKRAGEAEILNEWEQKRMKEDVEHSLRDAIHSNTLD